MSKVKLINRMAQALPVLLKNPSDPKNLRQIWIKKKGFALIKEEELSGHCQDLYERDRVDIEWPKEVKSGIKKEEIPVPESPKVEKNTSRNRRSSTKRKKTRKKGK